MRQHPISENLVKRAPECRTEPPKGYHWVAPPFVMVLPFCERDARMALKLLEWIKDLGPVDRELVLVHDKGMRPELISLIHEAAGKTFATVYRHEIPVSGASWPGCNNFVWYHIAQLMKARGRPWLLLETDLAPCTPDWVQRLEDEYSRARKPFMGSWVEYYDIMNGAGVYPPDVMAWCPEFFRKNPLLNTAYDCAIAPEIIWFTHNATHMMPHIWFSRDNGRPGGMVPKLPEWTERMVDWVCTHNAVLIHRCKDETLIDILRRRVLYG